MTNTFFIARKARLLTGAASTAALLVLGATSAAAQDQAAAPATIPSDVTAESAPAPDIVVTGSRIARPDLAGSSPVAVISAETLKQNNVVTVESILAQNPQFLPAQGSSSNNPGTGAATVDLRGLGSQRTLVLIDGKRAPSYDSTGSVDVNAIPVALLKRVEVLTGGASAVYGSDAISGVVNFILDDRFHGLQADASTQISEQGDGAEYNASLTAGIKLGDRGNLVASGSYSKREGVYFGARSRNATALDSTTLTPTGSNNAAPTVFDNTFNSATGAPSYYQLGAGNDLVPYYAPYNYTPVNYAQLPFERYNFMVLGRYQLTDNIEAFVRGSYAHSAVTLTLAPTATAGYTFDISPTNPFLTAQQKALFFGDPTTLNADGTASIGIRRRITETAGRVENISTQNYQFVGGFRGTVGAGYKWEVFAQYGETKRHQDLLNDLSYSRLTQAVNAATATTCVDPSGGCVPINLFSTSPISAASLAYVLANGAEDDKTTQFVTGASISGDIGFLKSPFASKPAAVSVGVEYRRETASTKVNDAYASGDLIYYGQGQNISGSYDTKEAYIELKAPLIEDRPFIKSLNIEGGYRYSDYSTVGGVNTYKGGGDWTPVEGIRFRGIYQRAVRAPNIYELYSPVVAGTGSLVTDPCAGSGVVAGSALANLCVATGAPASSIGRIPTPVSGQINILTGGNPNLKAEVSDTYTLGVVINPPRLRALTLSVDYFSIKIANAINTFGGSEANIVNTCYAQTDASSPFCQAIKRNTSTGSLSGPITFGVSEQLANIAVIKTSGIDVGVGYNGKAGPFNYAVSLSGTWTDHYKVQGDPTSAAIECAGQFSSSCNLNPMPKWKHVFDVNLGYQGFSLLSRWRYIGAIHDPDGILVNRIKPYTYIDETLSVDVNKQFTLRVGAQNLFNRKSPIVGDTTGIDYNAGSTFPNVYDVIGRSFFAGITAKI